MALQTVVAMVSYLVEQTAEKKVDPTAGMTVDTKVELMVER